MERGELRQLTALVATHTAGNLGAGVLPILMGVLIADLGLGSERAGMLLSVELGAAFVATIAIAGRMARDSRRRWALVGALVTAGANAASALVLGSAWLLPTRALAGLGSGLLLASASAAAAGSREPDRLFASIALLEGLAFGVLLAALPLVTVPFGAAGAFATLAAVAVCAIPFVPGLPELASDGAGAPAGRAPHRPVAFATLASIALMSVAGMAIWALSERIGTHSGLGASGIGAVLGAATVLGLVGAGGAVWLGTSRGRRGPLLVGMALSIASMVALALAATAPVFVAAQLVWSVAFFFSTPYFLGVAAALDPAGRWTAAASGVSAAGSALGPLAAGLVGASPEGRAVAIAAAGALAMGLVLPALRRVR